jgi:hypothetical protein
MLGLGTVLGLICGCCHTNSLKLIDGSRQSFLQGHSNNHYLCRLVNKKTSGSSILWALLFKSSSGFLFLQQGIFDISDAMDNTLSRLVDRAWATFLNTPEDARCCKSLIVDSVQSPPQEYIPSSNPVEIH